MKIRLQEIELGTSNPDKSKAFYSGILGLETSIDQQQLKVFHTGVSGIDFNASTHFPVRTAVTSFVTDDLGEIMERLSENGIAFSGPHKSHLGMSSIEFKDPDGYLIRVNQPGSESPSWLTV